MRLNYAGQDRRAYFVLRARSRHMLSEAGPLPRNRCPKFGVMVGGTKSESECYAWLQRQGLPAQGRTLVPQLWKPCTIELVPAALQRMDQLSSLGQKV